MKDVRAATLAMLREKPDYCEAIARRIQERTGTAITGSAVNYVTTNLVEGGFARLVPPPPASRRGQKGVYFELTPEGLQEAEAERAMACALWGLQPIEKPAP